MRVVCVLEKREVPVELMLTILDTEHGVDVVHEPTIRSITSAHAGKKIARSECPIRHSLRAIVLRFHREALGALWCGN